MTASLIVSALCLLLVGTFVGVRAVRAARERRWPLQRRGGRADAAAHGVRAGALQAGRSLLDRAPAPARAAGGCGVRVRDIRRGDAARDVRGARLYDRSAGAAGAEQADSVAV